MDYIFVCRGLKLSDNYLLYTIQFFEPCPKRAKTPTSYFNLSAKNTKKATLTMIA
jgi:hypothetical protein